MSEYHPVKGKLVSYGGFSAEGARDGSLVLTFPYPHQPVTLTAEEADMFYGVLCDVMQYGEYKGHDHG